MKLSYLTPLIFPSRYVNRLQVMKMASAFTKQADFALYIAESHISRDNLFQTYAVKNPFLIKETGKAVFPPRRFWQARKVLGAISNAPPDTVWYVRDVLLADWLASMSRQFREQYVFELHTLVRFSEKRYQRVLSRARGIITTNDEKKKDIIEHLGISKDRILVAPNGVDVEEFRMLRSQKEAYKQKLGFTGSTSLVVYTGTDKEEYGTGILRQAAQLLGDRARVLIISGKPRREALEYMAAADVLVAPYLPASEHFRKYMSPMKIREYMAMERPIVVSDLLSIRACLPEDAAFYVDNPGVPAVLSDKILEVLQNKEEANIRARRASYYAQEPSFSWDSRAERIIEFIKGLS